MHTLIKAKSCNAFLRTLVICISMRLKSVLSYKLLILDNCHPDSVFMWTRMSRSVVTFEARRGLRTKFWETLVWGDSIDCKYYP